MAHDRYEWWLAGLTGISARKKKKLFEIYGSCEEVYRQIQYKIEGTDSLYPNCISIKDRELLERSVRYNDIDRSFEEGLKRNIRLIPFYSEKFPEKLNEQEGMPFAIYVLGKLPCEDQCMVAIVGSRQCTYYGEKMAAMFAETVALSGIAIISGMAAGIDGAALRASLSAGGMSFAVLGCGVDVCYPKENSGLYRDLIQQGGIISEYPPGMRPYRANFPARNRIISGLSDYVLVMEARAKSGSLITASMAAEQGKDVYALPGPVTSDLSRGCHELIADGAGILISGEQLVSDIKNRFSMVESCPAKDSAIPKKKLESKEKLVYASIGLFPQNVSELSAQTKLDAGELIKILLSLEMDGMIKEISKNYYVRV